MTAVEIHPAESRFHTELTWLDSWHCFSFGPHFDPANIGHGLLIVSNDDRVAPGGGFTTHAHRDMEIVTWVLDGELEHRDSAGHVGVIYPGLAQRMSAGTGIRHSEMNHSSSAPVHFLQMWVPPDRTGIEPGYEQADVNELLTSGALELVAASDGAAITIHQRDARLWVGRLDAGGTATLPDAPFVHCFVARGAMTLDGARLSRGDAARCTAAGPLMLTASSDSEIVVWESATAARR